MSTFLGPRTVTFSQITDASLLLTVIQNQPAGGPPPGTPAILRVGDSSIEYLNAAQTGQHINNGSAAFTGTLTPPLSLDIVNGSINTGS